MTNTLSIRYNDLKDYIGTNSNLKLTELVIQDQEDTIRSIKLIHHKNSAPVELQQEQ